MKKQLLTKMLLVAACLLTGTSVTWATNAFVQNFTGSSSDPVDYGFAVTTSDGCTATVGDGKLTLSAAANSGSDRSAAVTASFSAIGTGNIITFSCTWNPGGPTGTRAASNLVLQDGSGTAAMTLTNDGQAKTLSLNGTQIASGDDWRSSSIVWNVVATLNVTTNKILTLTLTKSGESTPAVSQSNIAFHNSVTSISKFYCQTTKKANWVCTSTLDNVSITYEPSTTPLVDYTINYKLGDDVVKTVSTNDDDGVTIYAETAVDGEGTFAGNHYLIIASVAPSITLDKDAAENVLNVSVRAPYTATLTVTKYIGGEAQTPEITTPTETDTKICSWAYTYPMYVQKDGVYYVADETSSFGESGNFTDGQSINKTVNYTNPDYSVVYFGEPNETNGTNTTYSNGSTGYIKGGVAYDSDQVIRLGTLPAGEYHLITNVVSDQARNVVVGDCTETTTFPTALVTITTTGAKDESFTLTAPKPISISGKDQGSNKFNQSATIDYILVKATKKPVSLGTNGYGTFASSYPLDLRTTSLPSGVTAYKASVSGTTVTFTALNQTVPANTGILIKGTGTSVDIPVAATGTTVTDNAFLVNTTGATFAGDDNYYYFGLVKNSLTFGQFAPNTVAIPANKAYLKVLKSSIDASPARGLNVVFEDEATGIEAVKAQNVENGQFFNLAGQRVAQPAKGLYIVNGKKVVVK